jgi:predicted Zn finger-like uncharacterized protein
LAHDVVGEPGTTSPDHALLPRERAMLIVCPTCATSYQIKLAALGDAGRSVRCASCKNTWFATPDSVVFESEAALTAVASRPLPPPAAPAQPPEAARPPENDYTDDMASAFSVVTSEPMDDPAAAEEAARALAAVESPPLAPQDPGEAAGSSAAKFDPDAPEDIETTAARRARQANANRKERRTALQRIVSMPVLIMVLLAILLAALQWRVALVRHFPQTASLFSMLGMPVNLRGLTFLDVKSRGEFIDGAMVLVVEGTIVNLTPRTLEIPRLRFGLRNGLGQEVYAWTALPSKTLLGSGDGLPFRSRLAAPPPDGRDVIVRFFSRRDAGLGS